MSSKSMIAPPASSNNHAKLVLVEVSGEDSEAEYESTKDSYVLQPTGVSANFMTVSLIMSSGKEDIRAERMNH